MLSIEKKRSLVSRYLIYPSHTHTHSHTLCSGPETIGWSGSHVRVGANHKTYRTSLNSTQNAIFYSNMVFNCGCDTLSNAALQSSTALNSFSPSCEIKKIFKKGGGGGGAAWYVPPCLPVSVKMTSTQINAACFKAFQGTFKSKADRNNGNWFES